MREYITYVAMKRWNLPRFHNEYYTGLSTYTGSREVEVFLSGRWRIDNVISGDEMISSKLLLEVICSTKEWECIGDDAIRLINHREWVDSDEINIVTEMVSSKTEGDVQECGV